MKNTIIEINKKKTKAGRTPVKLILHEIYNDDSEYNNNGISWTEEYVEANIDSVAGMPIVAQFLDDEYAQPFGGHGKMTVDENRVVFEDSLVVGTFESAYIAKDIEVNNKKINALIGVGHLYNQRFPNLVNYLQNEHEDGNSVEGSVEICGIDGNKIVYDGGYKPKGRKPKEYDYSGHAFIIGQTPADNSALMIEINSYKEGKKDMKDKANKKGAKFELNALSYDDLAILTHRAFNSIMNNNKWYGIHKFYPTTSEVIFSSWEDIGKYYKTTYSVNNAEVTLGDIIEVEEDWKPIKGESVEINTSAFKNISSKTKGGKKMEELIREKDQKIEELNGTITELNTKLDDATKANTDLEAKVSELNETIVEVNKTMETNKAENEKMTVELNRLKEVESKQIEDEKKAEVNSYFETEIKKNGFSEDVIKTLKTEYVEKNDLEGLIKAESELCVKRVKEMAKLKDTVETNSDNTDIFVAIKNTENADEDYSDIL